MDKITWLIDKLPMPCVLHDKSTIIHANVFFTRFLSKHYDLKQLDFNQWLSHSIQKKSDSNLLIEAITNRQNISLTSEGHANGTLYHWTIHSYPIPSGIANKPYQITCFQDSSSASISKSYWELHTRVSKATMQLVQEISDRKDAEEKAENLNIELLKIQQDLITASHQAGMAEVAVSVLHNIGNVLNSVGVSLTQMKTNISSSLYKRLTQVNMMLKEHEANLTDYFQNDEEGKLLLQYLVTLFEEIQQQNVLLETELNQFQKHYLMLKDILSAQNESTKHTSVIEKVYLSELIDKSIHLVLTEDSLLTNSITINRDYKYNSFVMTDRIHLMQLLVNLIKNAKESIMELKADVLRKINISIEIIEDKEQIEIDIVDNGIGILPENLSKLFRFGFSTKNKGHGFGLHNSSLIAQQLGGTLRAESEGQGMGAKFILTLPISHATH